MVQSNEFKGATLAEAVKKATAAYNKAPVCEVKNQRRCNDLVLSISSLSSTAANYAREARTLEREARALRSEAIGNALAAGFAVVGGFIAAVARFRRTVEAIERATRNKKLTRADIEALLASAGALGAAALTALAALKLFDAMNLSHQAEELAQNAERLGRRLETLREEYDRLGCGNEPGFTGI